MIFFFKVQWHPHTHTYISIIFPQNQFSLLAASTLGFGSRSSFVPPYPPPLLLIQAVAMVTTPYPPLSLGSTSMTNHFLWVSDTPALHLFLTGRVSHGKSLVSHIVRSCGCVCVCLLVWWDVCAVRLHTCVKDTCSKHNSRPSIRDGESVNHCLSPPRHRAPLFDYTSSPEIAPHSVSQDPGPPKTPSCKPAEREVKVWEVHEGRETQRRVTQMEKKTLVGYLEPPMQRRDLTPLGQLWKWKRWDVTESNGEGCVCVSPQLLCLFLRNLCVTVMKNNIIPTVPSPCKSQSWLI